MSDYILAMLIVLDCSLAVPIGSGYILSVTIGAGYYYYHLFRLSVYIKRKKHIISCL